MKDDAGGTANESGLTSSSVALASPRFRENLAVDCKCPPDDATVPEEAWVFRLVPSDPVELEHFDSHAKNSKLKPSGVDSCRWASCSVFRETTSITKLPKPKGMRYIAKFKINRQSGLIKESNHGHLDLWMFATFNPLDNCTIVSELSHGK
ncbi:MAG: hypothetical protein POG74_11125 [Acidocella sp.]|nr:hypothetical protein [Acidocella sp.]